MNSSLLIGQLFGPILVIMGLAIMINPVIIKYIQKLESTKFSLYLESTFRLILGITIVTIHNNWSSFVNILISLIGRTILIFGIIGLFAPKLLKQIDKPFYKSKILMNARIIFIITIGFIVTYLSYIS